MILKTKRKILRNKIKNRLKKTYVKFRNKPKIFVIGFNKTGTTSVHHALLELNLIVGEQRPAEKLLDDIIENKHDNLIAYCEEAEAFQDMPFSCPDLYKVLDKKFPKSKFILTVRDNDEQWFNSMVKFHGKLWATNSNGIPTKNDLANANYVYKGFPLKSINYKFGDYYYDKDVYCKVYNKHNNDVIKYFKDRKNDLLVINVAEKNSYNKLCKFIDVTPKRDSFEWKNKTDK